MRLSKQKAQLFNQLSVLEEAGISAKQALRTAGRAGSDFEIEKIYANLKAGKSLSESFRLADSKFTRFDHEFIALGEKTGKVGQCYKKLSEYYEFIAQTQSTFKNGLLYPKIILHVAPLLLYLPDLFRDGSFVDFIISCLTFLAPFYFFVLIFRYLLPAVSKQSEALQHIADGALQRLPLVGTAYRDLQIANFAMMLSFCLEAGSTMFDGLDLTIRNTQSPVIRSKIKRVKSEIKAGATLSTAIAKNFAADGVLRGLLLSGEQSGKMPQLLQKIAEYYQAAFKTTVIRISKVLPTLIFLVLGAIVGYRIISSYQNIWSQIG